MKNILITGGSSGIGAEIVRRFASEGYNVAISYRSNEAGAKQVANDIEAIGVQCFVQQAELGSETAAKQLVQSVVDTLGRVDVVVNNAGGYIDGDEWDGTEQVWTETLSQNLVSVMNVSKYAAHEFKKQKSGVLINIASRHGMTGHADAVAYSAAKAGVINLTGAYAELLAPDSRAVAISPGAVNTGYWLTAPADELAEAKEQMPAGRLVEPTEVADTVFYVVAEDGKELNGTNIVVDGTQYLSAQRSGLSAHEAQA
ncbi:MAG: SDR family NAD(P)-dependent oxidoreductase [Gammaproteobacteria bacterium]|nr:SDR family NAD(P)-dependent oxidoreductase [Gammaproteobacteria bacterium]